MGGMARVTARRRVGQPPFCLATALLALWALAAIVLWPSVPEQLVETSSCVPIERVLWAPHVVTAHFGVTPALVRVDRSGKIGAVQAASLREAEQYGREHGLPVEPHPGVTISPGVIDARVQLSTPGRDASSFYHATRAAAAGGVTTIIDGPFGSKPVATDKHGLQMHMRAAATDRLSVNVGFKAGISPASARDPLALFALASAGALGFYAVISPVHEEVGVDPLDMDGLMAAAETVARTGVPLHVRAELGDEQTLMQTQTQAVFEYEADRNEHVTHFRTRPGEWQAAALRGLAEVARAVPSLRLHAANVVLADSDATEALAAARAAGGPRFSADTTPHYLALDAFGVRTGDTRLKAEPAVRDEENRERLWALLAGGQLEMVSSDHAPCVEELRAGGDFLAAWAGVSGLQFLLQATWTEARRHGHDVARLARWLSEKPAELAGIRGKGRIEVGADADLVLWDPTARVRPPHAEYHRVPGQSPWANVTLYGRVEETLVGGVPVFSHGRHTSRFCGAVLLGHSAHTAGATW